MAFNFNWSPLTADASFYERARDLLTTALNKSPKPPIIVDDILVDELNLGTEPPDLEILEIGDLAEDRFRGIFKMCYTGNAFLTLRTRVQANPLNTYLYSKPSFTSPQPLAAASGLTIPLSITLSEIKLSAFIILVFSKQKGLTLVFRNDPLESLKVSSTFDSIQFVRDYLQRTIEQQLRNLMMDELPAIIHRLSVQLWCPDQAKQESSSPNDEEDETSIDPFASPPLDPVDTHGNLLDANDISELTLNGGGEVQSLFSQRNLLRLAALTDSHRTLSLFTPGMRDVVFRAWSGYGDRSEAPTPTVSPPSLTKTLSFHAGPSTTYTFSDSGSTTNGYLPSRASQVSLPSSTNGFALGSGHRARPGRKKKTRVVNLRRSRSEVASPECLSEEGSDTASESAPLSEPIFSAPTSDDSQSVSSVPTGSFSAGPTSHFEHGHSHHHTLSEHRPSPLSRQPIVADLNQRLEEALTSLPEEHATEQVSEPATPRPLAKVTGKQPIFTTGASPTSLEHAWVSKMAGEIARRFYDEKQRRHRQGVWEGQSETDALPPPTYEAATH